MLQPCLEFPELPRVLDGDDGLVSERAKKCDLIVSERQNFRTVEPDISNAYAVTDQRHGQISAHTLSFGRARLMGVRTNRSAHLSHIF